MIPYIGKVAKVELIYFIHPSTETGTSSVKSKKNTGNKVHKTINPSYISADEKCLWINGKLILKFFFNQQTATNFLCLLPLFFHLPAPLQPEYMTLSKKKIEKGTFLQSFSSETPVQGVSTHKFLTTGLVFRFSDWSLFYYLHQSACLDCKPKDNLSMQDV